jgi:hypothetical protein
LRDDLLLHQLIFPGIWPVLDDLLGEGRADSRESLKLVLGCGGRFLSGLSEDGNPSDVVRRFT